MSALAEAILNTNLAVPEAKIRRRRALASNVMSESLALEGRVIRTDDDARREEMIFQLLIVHPTHDANTKAEENAYAQGVHLPLTSAVQPEASPKMDLAERAVSEALKADGRIA